MVACAGALFCVGDDQTAGTGLQTQVTIDYDDVGHLITTTSDQAAYNDNLLKSQTLYDGLGRTTETRQYEGGTKYLATQQQYDALGRASQRERRAGLFGAR